jgi:hypothetical protein
MDNCKDCKFCVNLPLATLWCNKNNLNINDAVASIQICSDFERKPVENNCSNCKHFGNCGIERYYRCTIDSSDRPKWEAKEVSKTEEKTCSNCASNQPCNEPLISSSSCYLCSRIEREDHWTPVLPEKNTGLNIIEAQEAYDNGWELRGEITTDEKPLKYFWTVGKVQYTHGTFKVVGKREK